MEYRRMKGWNGKVYYIRMSKEEVRERRELYALLIAAACMVSFLAGAIVAMMK